MSLTTANAQGLLVECNPDLQSSYVFARDTSTRDTSSPRIDYFAKQFRNPTIQDKTMKHTRASVNIRYTQS